MGGKSDKLEASATPRPWSYHSDSHDGFIVVWGDGNSVHVANTSKSPPEAVGDRVAVDVLNEANARLIAAAPDLLYALENLLGFSASPKSIEFEMAKDDARDAIARATGVDTGRPE